MAPRFVGALVAAGTDYATYRLAIKVLGPGAGETAVCPWPPRQVRGKAADQTDIPFFIFSVQRLRIAPSAIDLARDPARHSRLDLLPIARARVPRPVCLRCCQSSRYQQGVEREVVEGGREAHGSINGSQ